MFTVFIMNYKSAHYNKNFQWAVTKSGMGTWDLGCQDMEHRDAGTSGLRDAWGLEDVGSMDLRT